MSWKSNVFTNTGVSIVALASAVSVPAQVNAQTLDPVVDICSGVTLERSLITDVIGDVNDSIVVEIEDQVNDILGVPILGLLGPFSIDLSGALADAASGSDISLQVLNSDNVLVGPSDDCNIAADGFSLADPAGISIGGNAITGLGAENEGASAGDIDAIAFGNNAVTAADAGAAIAIGNDATVAAGATGGVALGNGASVTVPNGIAIGAGSVADRGALTGYTAPGLTGTHDSAGAVSIGSAGSLRQITNVAPGSAPTDAANVAQVQGALDAVSALADDAVQYDDATHATVTLDGASGTTLSNVAPGSVSAVSTEAVNGSQLFATNQNVTTNATAITSLDGRVSTNETDIANLDTRVTTNETDIANLTTQVTSNTTAITNLDGRVTTLEGDITGLDTRLTTVEGDITNLDTRLTTVEGDITGLDTRLTTVEGDITNLDTRVTTNETDIANLDTRVSTNETEIANLNTQVTTNTTAITNLDGRVTSNETDIANLDTQVTTNTTAISSVSSQVTSITNDVTSIDARVTVNSATLVTHETQLTDNSVRITSLETRADNTPLRYVEDSAPDTFSDTPTNTVRLMGAGGNAVTVNNVADGELSETSNQAVNGSQLHASNTQIANNSTRIDSVTQDMINNTHAVVQYSSAQSPQSSTGGPRTNHAMLVGANSSAPVMLHNVADAMAATDAVNLRQMEAGMAAAEASARAYTDTRFSQLAFDLDKVRKDSHAGVAGALAMAGLPQVFNADTRMVAGSVGHYRGETAMAMRSFASTARSIRADTRA